MSKAIAAEYQAAQWIMEPEALKAFAERIAGLPESASIYSIKIEKKKNELTVVDGVALIKINGYLLDTVPDWMAFWGIKATGYDRIKEQMAEAAAREDVQSIELTVDSPGGMVAGVIGAADSIYAARSKKPVTAVVNNLSASGAYWLTSQADKITASDINALIGSIGVFTYYVDWTGFEDKAGIKVIVIRSGEHKGMGLDTITDNQVAAVQEYIDDTAANFIASVARGRQIDSEKINELATGKLWIAAKAKRLGLIDRVIAMPVRKKQTAEANDQAGQIETSQVKEQIMSEEQKKNVADEQAAENQKQQAAQAAVADERARINKLNEAFAEDPAFAMKAAAEGWTLEQAKAEYCDVLAEKLKARDKEKAQNENQRTEGSAPLTGGDTDSGAEGDFMAQARELAKEKKISVTAAMKQLRRTKPELHQAHLQSCEQNGKAMYNQIA